MVASEEGAEVEPLGRPRDGEQVVVARAQLGLGEQAQLHVTERPKRCLRACIQGTRRHLPVPNDGDELELHELSVWRS